MSYMCYSCDEAKESSQVKRSDQGLLCTDCNTGFIEEMTFTDRSSPESPSGAVSLSEASARLAADAGDLDRLVREILREFFGVVGSLEDVALGFDSLDDVVTQLMNQIDGGGPPPATSDDLRRVQLASISASQVEQGLQCFVCFDEFALMEGVSRLPCQHHYHADCIMPWLQKHGTCPVCRKTLSGEDTTTLTFADAGDVNGAASSSYGRRGMGGDERN